MDALMSLLTRERLLAELVVFKLLELRALLSAGEGRFLAWAAEATARGEAAEAGAGARGPVEAFGLDRLEAGCAESGIKRSVG